LLLPLHSYRLRSISTVEFWFCEKCGKRVSAEDIARGASRTDEGKAFCLACASIAEPVPAPRMGPTPAAGTGRNSLSKAMQPAERAAQAPVARKSETSTLRAPPRGDTGRIHAHERSSQQRINSVQGNSNTPMFVLGGAAGIVIIGGLIVAFSGSSKSTSREAASHDAPSVQAAGAEPAKATPARSTTTAVTLPTVVNAPVTARVIESDPEAKARDAFSELEKNIPGIDGADKKIAALDEFINKNPDAIAAARARRLRASITNPAPAQPPALDGPAIVARANEKCKVGDFAGAIAEYDRAVALTDKEPIFFQNRADVKRMAGDFEGVIADADKALAFNDGNLAAWELRAIGSYALKRDDDVYACIDKAAAVSGLTIPALTTQLTPEFQRARTFASGKALESKDPSSGEEFVTRGAYRMACGKREQALADLNEGLKRDPSLGPAGLFLQLAEYSRADKNFAGAMRYIKQWSESKPASAVAINAYAWELLTSSDAKLIDVKAALPLAERAAELSQKKEPAILDTLALAYFKNKRISSAIAMEQKAIDLLPAGAPPEVRKNYERRLGEYKAAEGVPSNPFERQ
jgi:tetratricopeptide (TPR) repeat protein